MSTVIINISQILNIRWKGMCFSDENGIVDRLCGVYCMENGEYAIRKGILRCWN